MPPSPTSRKRHSTTATAATSGRPAHPAPVPEGTLEGLTIQWTFDDGPTRGTTFEHTFNADGSVDFSMVKDGKPGKKTHVGECATVQAGKGVFLVSYLAEGGYTLTVALDFDDDTVVGFASNESDWSQQSGTFEVVHSGARPAERSSSKRPKARPT
ncbi:MAG TPA: hypothetical protein VM286_08990 [Candidatus Thermoplasmatota archaeon]|nr:hypothetical protein [Candidatus Thermoplasmatota archaeon]